MKNQKNVVIGDIVYTIAAWTDNIISCRVKSIEDFGVYYDGVAVVDKDGRSVSREYGSAGAIWDNVFLSAKEAYDERQSRNDACVQQHLDSIKTVKDLISFPFLHCVNGGEYTDYEAAKAYKIKAKEMFEVEIEL